MTTVLEVDKGQSRYHTLIVNGEMVAMLWGDVKITGKRVGDTQQVTVGGSNCQLWVDEIKKEDSK